MVAASFVETHKFNRLQHSPMPTARTPSKQLSPTKMNMFQIPWFNKGGSKSKDKKDVWGDGSVKDESSTKKPTSSSTASSSSNKAGLGGVAGIMDSMENFKTAQQVGKMTNSLVQDLQKETFEGVGAEGKVRVLFDGQQRPVGVKIDETYLAGIDASDLSVALTTAMKDAYQKSSEKMDEKMKSFYVDLGLK